MRIMVLYFLPVLCLAQDLPAGWRLAQQNELLAGSQQATQLDADFNGDGIVDSAYVLKSTEFSGEGLLVYLSSEQGHQWQVLERIDWGVDYPQVALTMALGLAKAQNYLTACGKGQWLCDEYEAAEFAVQYPAIWYYRIGGHRSLFYWNAEQQKFDKQWISN